MNYMLTLRSYLRPMRVLLCTFLSAVLFFASGCSALAAKSPPTKGTVQLDQIEQKAEDSIADPAMSLDDIVERSKGGLNEVQGKADLDKMNRSDDTKVPVIKQAEKAINKMKKG